MTGAGRDALLLVALKALLGAWVLHLGFSHVSDDDYARVVIAQLFAHAPRLDPSGTSWLPLPFWTTGGAMLVFGRSLEVARGLAFVAGALSVVPPYLAMRVVGVGRGVALVATALAAAAPWNAWLGVATVPEAMTGALIAAGAIAATSDRARVWAGVALFAAALSRYEAWSVCAVVAIYCAWTAWARRSERRVALRACAASALCAAGPLAWLAWNAHAHGSATHFVDRVARFQQAIGGGDASFGERLFGYPRALVEAAPALVVLGVIGAVGLRDAPLRDRWALPLGAIAVMLAFLVESDVRGSTATHHAVRALVGAFWVLAGAGIDTAWSAVRAIGSPSRRQAAGALAAIGAVAAGAYDVVAVRGYPGASASEDRAPQEARGRELAAANVARVELAPCAFEHFALMAAFGAPERIVVAAADERAAVDARCPREISGGP